MSRTKIGRARKVLPKRLPVPSRPQIREKTVVTAETRATKPKARLAQGPRQKKEGEVRSQKETFSMEEKPS